MTFETWVQPFLEGYPLEAEIFRDHVRRAKSGKFKISRASVAQERYGVSIRFLYKLLRRMNGRALIYEVLVLGGRIS